MNITPYANLTPDCVLNALESVGLFSDGRLLALNSYENRVYQIGMEEGPPMVAKFYRPERWRDAAILEEHEFLRELAESELPVIPPWSDEKGESLHQFEDFRFAVFPRQGGHAPEFDDPAILERMGRLLGRIHAVGALKAYRERPTLDIASFGKEPSDYVLQQGFVPVELVDSYRESVAQALDKVRECFAQAGDVAKLRLHGDCYAGNILWTEAGPHFVDFDDSRMGPAIQDLWMLLSGDRAERRAQLGHLLAGYEDFFEFDSRELWLIEALRTLRLIHYSGWIARRWDDPAFPVAFPWFDSPHYWQERIAELREQLARMNEPPLWALG